LATAGQSGQNLVSLGAVWWNEQGSANVWLVTEEGKIRSQEVKTGRTLGDKIEVLEGLNQGARIVSKATSELKAGMQLNQISPDKEPTAEEEPAGDGHGHSHDE
jgi:multidrug efflux pump subunit AcrA (membrane-fusion protein)